MAQQLVLGFEPVPAGKSRWFCHKCKTRFYTELEFCGELSCPSGHFMGVWDRPQIEKRKCGICGAELVIIKRTRLDEKTPTGKQIVRTESLAFLEHFQKHHPEVLIRAFKELGFKLRRR